VLTLIRNFVFLYFDINRWIDIPVKGLVPNNWMNGLVSLLRD
jgi:hypothetical protein